MTVIAFRCLADINEGAPPYRCKTDCGYPDCWVFECQHEDKEEER